jgi:hypothetical protein
MEIEKSKDFLNEELTECLKIEELLIKDDLLNNFSEINIEEEIKISKLLIKNIDKKEQNYFKEKYLRKNVPILYASNKYGEFFLKNEIPFDVCEYIYNEMNGKINKEFEELIHLNKIMDTTIYTFYDNDLLTKKEKNKKKKKILKLESKYYKKLKKNSLNKKIKKSLKSIPIFLKCSVTNSVLSENKKSLKNTYCKKELLIKLFSLYKKELNIDISYDEEDLMKNDFIINISGLDTEIKFEEEKDILGQARGTFYHSGRLIEVNCSALNYVEKEISLDDLFVFAHELGHACEEVLINQSKYVDLLEKSSESISLYFEKILTKNIGKILNLKKEDPYINYVDFISNYISWVESYLCKQIIKGRTQTEFKKDKKSYDNYLIYSQKERALFNDLYIHYDFDRYLVGHQLSDKLKNK